jgi:hypothetical protein
MPVASRRSLTRFFSVPLVSPPPIVSKRRAHCPFDGTQPLCLQSPLLRPIAAQDPANSGHILGIPGTCFGSFVLVRAGYEAEGQLGSGRIFAEEVFVPSRYLGELRGSRRDGVVPSHVCRSSHDSVGLGPPRGRCCLRNRWDGVVPTRKGAYCIGHRVLATPASAVALAEVRAWLGPSSPSTESDNEGQFSERVGETKGRTHIGSQIVEAPAEVLDEGMAGDDDPCGVVSLQPAHGSKSSLQPSVVGLQRVV